MIRENVSLYNVNAVVTEIIAAKLDHEEGSNNHFGNLHGHIIALISMQIR